MTQIFVVRDSEKLCKELLAVRRLTLRLSDSKPLEAEYVILASGRVPNWIAKVDSFTVLGGQFPKDAEISLSEVVCLSDAWTEVSELTRGLSIESSRLIDVDVVELLRLGKSLTAEYSSAGVLTVADAVPRLAWTYGVPCENVKVAIEF